MQAEKIIYDFEQADSLCLFGSEGVIAEILALGPPTREKLQGLCEARHLAIELTTDKDRDVLTCANPVRSVHLFHAGLCYRLCCDSAPRGAVAVAKLSGGVAVPVSKWSTEDVAAWLKTLDDNAYAPYSTTFLENAISGEVLLSLKESDLREIGIVVFGHRRAICGHVAEMAERANGDAKRLDVANRACGMLRSLLAQYREVPGAREYVEKAEQCLDANKIASSENLSMLESIVQRFSEFDGQLIEFLGFIHRCLGPKKSVLNIGPPVPKEIGPPMPIAVQEVAKRRRPNEQLGYDEKREILQASFSELKRLIEYLRPIFSTGAHGPSVHWKEYLDWIVSNMKLGLIFESIKNRKVHTREIFLREISSDRVKSFDSQLFLLPTNKRAKGLIDNPEPSGARQCRKYLRKILKTREEPEIENLVWKCFSVTQKAVEVATSMVPIEVVYPDRNNVHFTLDQRGKFTLLVRLSSEQLKRPCAACESDEHFLVKDSRRYEAVQVFSGGVILQGTISSGKKYYVLSTMQDFGIPDIVLASITVSLDPSNNESAI